MGLFGKIIKSFSGAEGQMEVQIDNALDYIKRDIGHSKMLAYHKKDNQLFWWFAYGIATATKSQFDRFGNNQELSMKVFDIVREALEKNGLSSGDSKDYPKKDEVFGLGRQYAYGVFSKNRANYMDAISSIVSIINK